jgi:hypothetical protein
MYQLLHARTLGMIAIVCGLSLASAATAGDDDLSIKKWRDGEKTYVTNVGEAVIVAAHPTARKKELLKYEFAYPKPNRTELVIKMEYHGAVTGKTYVADITVKIDTSNKDAWEVVNIDYVDNNTVGANLKKIQELIKKLNK